MDCEEHYNDQLKSQFSFIVPLIIELSYIFTLLVNIGVIVNEKTTKMKVRPRN